MLPTNNQFDIPVLRLDMQATIVPPVMPWGAVSRTTRMPGSWHFFVDDYRFAALLRDPARLLQTGCAAAVEPNLTIYDQTPRALVIEATYRKRYAARVWQDAGVRMLVDLNVPARFSDITMLGVPRGWRAFATRGYARRPDDLRAEHDLACSWAGGIPLLLVVGGGAPIEALCRELAGCVFVPDFAARRKLATNDRGLHLAKEGAP